MPPQPPITLTGLLAFYGPILSSIALGWNIYRDVLDRARLKVSARFGNIAASTTGQLFGVSPYVAVQKTKQLYVFIDVTNVGRRPLRWVGLGGKYHTPTTE